MIFTSRLYRKAIRYSILRERTLIHELKHDEPGSLRAQLTRTALQQQTRHTRRLQARKRRNRK